MTREEAIMTDLISRADAIEAVRKELVCDGRHEAHDKTCRFIADVLLSALPSAEHSKPLQTTLNGDLVSRADAIELFEKYKPRMAVSVYEYGQALKALPSAEANPTVVRCKTMIPYGDFREWAKRIREDNPNVIVIPFDAEVASADAVPQLKQTDTLIIADALRYLAQDTERHLADRTRADALRQQFLKYGASMCKGGDTE